MRPLPLLLGEREGVGAGGRPAGVADEDVDGAAKGVLRGGHEARGALGFTQEQWEGAHRSLVLAPLALIGAVMPGMRERGWGRILNVASTSVREPIPAIMLSNTERAGVLAAFKTIARQVAGDGVTLNTLLTGQILTDRLVGLAGSVEAAQANARAKVPAGRPGTVEEFAAVAAFLCGEPASYVTGAAIPVDGGMLQGV